jgi:hypothetical protein
MTQPEHIARQFPATAAEALKQAREVFGPGVRVLFAASDDGRQLGNPAEDELRDSKWTPAHGSIIDRGRPL